MRVALDTQVLVSAFTTRGLCDDVLNVVLAEHELVLGEAVLAELRQLLDRKMRMHPELVEDALAFLRREAVLVSSAPSLSVRIRDADDLVVLSQAVAGLAEVVVSGDHDLRDVAETLPLPVVSPRGFWEMLRGTQAGVNRRVPRGPAPRKACRGGRQG